MVLIILVSCEDSQLISIFIFIPKVTAETLANSEKAAVPVAGCTATKLEGSS